MRAAKPLLVMIEDSETEEGGEENEEEEGE
jgi:hypothetical protein